jgi:integrase
MSRFRKPFFKKSHDCWYVQIEGRQVRLSKDRDEAFLLYHKMMSEAKKAARFQTPQQPEGPLTLGKLWDRYLKVVSKDLAPKTIGWYIEKVLPFIDHLGREMPVETLRPFHLQDWIAAHPQWNRGTARNVIQAIKRVFNWAEKNRMVGNSPLHGVKKPPATRRTTVVEEEQYQEVLDNIRSSPFKDVVQMCYLTGIRPQELKLMRAEHYDPEGGRIVLPPEEAKGHQWPRVIYLPEEAKALVERRVSALGPKGKGGHIFTNTQGKPWTTTALATEWGRVQQRMGANTLGDDGGRSALSEAEIQAKVRTLSPTHRVNGEERVKSQKVLRSEAVRKLLRVKRRDAGPKRLCLYNFRHTFATRTLKSGVDALTTAILLGHRDPSTLARVYSHLSQSPEYLKEALRKSTKKAE